MLKWLTFNEMRLGTACFFGLVCLFFHPFGHTCDTGHGNYRLQFIYYDTTYSIWTSTQYNIINNDTKFKEDQMEVQSVSISI
jgi:hypothetical protein